MKVKSMLTSAVVGCALLLSGPAVFADDDSSADVRGGFTQAVDASDGVMIRVPVNDQGQENTNAAELRIHSGDGVDASTNLASVWNNSSSAADAPQVTSEDINADSSTNRWGFNRYRWNYGWNNNYYWNYRPYYYNYGSYYNYGQPYYYGYSGYNYYYYPRYYW